jgi:hypothetical protein
VATIAASRPTDEVVYFCEANVPIAKRNELMRWASSKHGLELQIFDGTAIAEMLAEAEVFWIAQEFLHLPAEAFPTVAGNENLYQEHYTRWQTKTPLLLSTSDFLEVKFGLRRATFESEARPHLLHWLALMDKFRAPPATRDTARAAAYEIAVANFRGKNDLNPAKELVVDYFSDVETWLAPSDLQDAATLVVYAVGAWSLRQLTCDLSEICAWRHRIADILDLEIEAAEGPGRRAALLRVRAILAPVPTCDGTQPDLGAGFRDWEQMLDAAEQAPLFPIEDFTDHLNKLAPMIGNHPCFRPLIERAEDLVARKAGPAVAAEKSFDRAIASYERDDLLTAIRDLHQIQQRWFTGDHLEGFQRATLLLSHCYLDLGLAYAAKYLALVGAYLALHGERPEIKARLSQMLMRVADADDGAGNSLSYIQMLLLGIGAHCAFEPDPFDQELYPELRTELGQVAALRGIAARFGSGHKDLVDEALARWPEPLRHSVVLSSKHPDGFWLAGADDEVWNDIEEAFIGRPFGDLGSQRRIEWRALGIRWVACFQNRYEETAIAEEFVAQLQIAQTALAGVDLLLLPTTVRMELSLASDEDAFDLSQREGGISEEGITVSVRLPASDLAAVNAEGASRSIVKVAADIVRRCSALPNENLVERVGLLLGDALSRVFIGRPYREIYRETMLPAFFHEDARRRLETLAPERTFGSREHVLLRAPQGPGLNYEKERSLRSVRERYERGGQSIRYTLRRLLASAARRALLESWRREGLLDWEILAILANVAANIRFPLTDDGPTSEQIERMRAMFDRAEAPEEALDPALFTDELLALNRHTFHGALAAGWELEGSPAVADKTAIEKFLKDRYGLRSDDVQHENLFQWGPALE